MRYLLMIYRDERASEARTPAEAAAGIALHTPYIETLRRNGQYAGSHALAGARAAWTVRSAAGKPVATQGPFAESREQLGGYYVVDAADLDAAIDVAARCPALQTVGVAIEIRPIAATVAAALDERAAGPLYLLMIYRDDAADDDDTRRAAVDAWWPQVANRAPADAAPLAPSGSATTLRLVEGKRVLADGPFADAREQLWGYCVVAARDTDAAIEAATELASGSAATQAIEVRPIRT